MAMLNNHRVPFCTASTTSPSFALRVAHATAFGSASMATAVTRGKRLQDSRKGDFTKKHVRSSRIGERMEKEDVHQQK